MSNRIGDAIRLIAACAIGCALPGLAEAQAQGGRPSWSVVRTITRNDGLPSDDVRALCPDGERVWVGTTSGLAIVTGEHIETILSRADAPAGRGAAPSATNQNTLTKANISAVGLDRRTDDVWVGTWGGGLLRYSAGRVDRFDQLNSGLAGDIVFSVAVAQRKVWIATNGGVSAFDPIAESWELYWPRRKHERGTAVTTFTWHDSELFVGAWRDGVYRFNETGGNWQPLTPGITTSSNAPFESPEAFENVVGVAGNGTSLVVATQRELYRRNREAAWQRRELPSALLENTIITCVALSEDGAIWLGTNRGLIVLEDWDHNRWTRFAGVVGNQTGDRNVVEHDQTTADRVDISRALPGERVRCVSADGDRVWVGTDGGLVVLARATTASRVAKSNINVGTDRDGVAPEYSTSNDNRVASTAIAVFGPRTKTVALPDGRMTEGEASKLVATDLLAVQLALERVNAKRREDARTGVELILRSPGYDVYGWGTREDDFPFFTSFEHVSGIVGSVRPNDPVDDLIVLRSEVPAVALTDGERTPTDGRNPWIFHCQGEGPRQHRLMIDYLIDARNVRRMALIMEPDTLDGKRSALPCARANLHARWWRQQAERRDRPFILETAWPVGRDENASEQRAQVLQELADADADAVLTWGSERTVVGVMEGLSDASLTPILVAGPQIVTAGSAARFTGLKGELLAMRGPMTDATAAVASAFADSYAMRNTVSGVPTPPGADAVRSFVAADHLLEADRRAGDTKIISGSAGGTQRDTVRRALQLMEQSVMGEAHFERLHPEPRLGLARIRAGRWVFESLSPKTWAR